MSTLEPVLIDCTLRDGGYHNDWDFPTDLIEEYLQAMAAISVDVVELGFRGFEAEGFRGGCAYTTDRFIESLTIPDGLTIGVMVNAAELVQSPDGVSGAVDRLFKPAADSRVTMVRLASHVGEFDGALEATTRLQELGYRVGVNLMQIGDRTDKEVEEVARRAAARPPDVLYFADSLGSMDPDQTAHMVRLLRRAWDGALGIHTHDNMGRALANSLRALEEGVEWLDATVTGMGRGPGNVRTENLVIELAERRSQSLDIVPLVSLVEHRFRPLQAIHGWGTNTYYYLAGKYGVHPTYVQSMLADSRYAEEDVLAVLEYLRLAGGKKFSVESLETGRNFYDSQPSGSWAPADLIKGRDVLLLGSGPGVAVHRSALVHYIESARPVVVAFNTDLALEDRLVDLRVASHPYRLLSNAAAHLKLPQPLVTPASMLPESVRDPLDGKELLDFGLAIRPDTYEFSDRYCVLPTSLTVAYALAVAASGRANRILLAGFDGYSSDDPRNIEVDHLFAGFSATEGAPEVVAIPPSRYDVASGSVYALA